MSHLLQHWVTHHAELRPDAVAVVMDQTRFTYGQVESLTNQLAWELKAQGCKKGDRVCLLIPKSPIAIVAILAVLKADCIYVPVDTASPMTRVKKVIESCEPRCLLAAGPITSLLDDLLSDETLTQQLVVGWLAATTAYQGTTEPAFTLDNLQARADTQLKYQNTSADPAYILFTSGSTGTPKGVVITHDNVWHFVQWANNYFGLEATDRVSGHSPLHFDLSVYDMFGALAAGAQLYLVPPKLNLLPNKLAEFIREAELTQWFSVPSALNYMAKFDVVRPNDFPSLKRLLWCGEVLPTPTLIYWMERLPNIPFTNLYGPTEATIASSYYTIPACPKDPRDAVPIGTACTDEALCILSEDLKPVPQGEMGDLYIAGVGLSPGYWQDPVKTQAAFLNTPHSNGASNPQTRIYKTGDLASLGKDGLIYFHGRADSQIKSRGYRIELGEIETALNAIHVLEECAVVAVENNSIGGANICCAYVPSTQNGAITPVMLRQKLSVHLPNYMLPGHWLAFENLPKNANGKIDRPALRTQFEQTLQSQQSRVR